MAQRWLDPKRAHGALVGLFFLILMPCGCGDDGDGTKEPAAIEGLFVQVLGAHQQTFSLSADEAQVECRPKPALSEFEYKAQLGDASSGSYLELLLKDYTAAGTYQLTGTDGLAEPQVSVGWPGSSGHLDFQGSFSAGLRVDGNADYNSSCELELTTEAQGLTTQFNGVLTCAMLWPVDVAQGELDASESSFIDLVAKFECSY